MDGTFEGAELNIYTTDGQNLSIDLSPFQLMAVCGMLGLKYQGEGSVTCLSDKSLAEFYSKTVGRFKEVE
jgi:hypothetical protein